LLERAEITEFVFHDLRRTVGSWQAHIGSSDIIIGKSLGHHSTQSTRVYARIRDNNPIKNSMVNGFAAMKKASRNPKMVNLGDKS
jgi:integrase